MCTPRNTATKFEVCFFKRKKHESRHDCGSPDELVRSVVRSRAASAAAADSWLAGAKNVTSSMGSKKSLQSAREHKTQDMLQMVPAADFAKAI